MILLLEIGEREICTYSIQSEENSYIYEKEVSKYKEIQLIKKLEILLSLSLFHNFYILRYKNFKIPFLKMNATKIKMPQYCLPQKRVIITRILGKKSIQFHLSLTFAECTFPSKF